TIASTKAVELHFRLATIGVVLYISAMWVAGVMQGLMWRATGDDGTLTYATVEGVKATYPLYTIRMIGGLFCLSGVFLMAWNTYRTIKGQPKPNAVVHLQNPDAIHPKLVGPAKPATGAVQTA